MRQKTLTIIPMALMIAGAISTTAFAQTHPPNIRSITQYTVKPERAADMAAAIKEYNEILAKAHYDQGYTIWRSLSGPTEMVQVTYHNKWAELDVTRANDPKLKDQATTLANIARRINDSFSSVKRVVDVVNGDASLPRQPEPPPMILVWVAHVKPGKMAEALALEKDEYLPAVKAAGFKTYVLAHTRFGGPSNELRSSVGLSNWAEFDNPNPIGIAMGKEKYDAFTTKMNAMLDDYTYEIYRLDKALSYVPSK